MNEVITIRQSRLNRRITLCIGLAFLIMWIIAVGWYLKGLLIPFHLISIAFLIRFFYCKAKVIKIYSDNIEYHSFFYRKTIYNFKEVKLKSSSFVLPAKFSIIGQNNKILATIWFSEQTKEIEDMVAQLNKAPFVNDKKSNIQILKGKTIATIILVTIYLLFLVICIT